ncbi:MAG TPA: alpha/beta hydrolase [Dehalococcoidia bacterium]|nr:alpha/beta hydrolase [Dehalococcoidia bacterium]
MTQQVVSHTAEFRGGPFYDALPDNTAIEPQRLFADDSAESAGVLYYPAGRLPRTVCCLMHPRGDFARHYAVPYLVAAGYAAWGHNSRYLNNDTEAIHERLVLDIAAGLRHLRARGFQNIVLLGNSGGASLYAFYQAQAVLPPAEREQDTPGGSHVDLTGDLPAGDGFVALAAHSGEGLFMLQSIDPSVTDEADPLSCDPALDMFNPENGYDPGTGTATYARGWLASYREAQRARHLRLDAIARAHLAEEREGAGAAAGSGMAPYALIRARRRAIPHRLMLIYRTVANPAYLDLSIDPNRRPIGTIFGGPTARPEFGNYFSSNISRVLSPRAWLSTWSGTSSRANFVENARSITVPTLFTAADGDSDILPANADSMWNAIAAPDKVRHDLSGADHYLRPLPDAPGTNPRAEFAGILAAWLKQRFPA